MMLTRIHVNQIKIRSNMKRGTTQPVLTIKGYKPGNKTHSTNEYAHEAIIRDAEGVEVARVVYRPNDPLPCGAKVWIETENDVEALIIK